jgi:UDP-N-acetylglucosamine/UDP-N-acetyl-alpha-D-glucosaminouronate 4-epimerase
VTGGSGFLGTHVCRGFAAKGIPVADFSPRPPAAANRRFLGTLAVTHIDGDTRDGDHLQACLHSLGVSTVIHMAAVNGEDAARRDPALAIAVNVLGTATVLSAAAATGVKRVVYIGSGTQYGPSNDLRSINEDTCSRPHGLYASTKQAAECIATAAARLSGIEFVSLRVSAPYGPLETVNPSPMHVRFWIDSALSGKEIRLDGADHPRDLTYVDDTAAGIVAAVLAPRLASSVINIASGETVRMGAVVSAVQQLVNGAHISLGPGHLCSDDPRVAGSIRGPLSIERARNELGFEPKIRLAEGIARYLTWVRAESRFQARDH